LKIAPFLKRLGGEKMGKLLLDGIPEEKVYRPLLTSPAFKELEKFSHLFSLKNKKSLRAYGRKWVEDSLHQWNRQWEYPFVLSKIQSCLNLNEKNRILDAGSGVTFFPYYIKSKYQSCDIYCCDNDKALTRIFQKINNREHSVEFSCADLQTLPYEDDWFEIVYCISVLEHTDNYRDIIDEFYRVIKPKGRLMVTFDVSMDGTRQIIPEKGAELLQMLKKKFDVAKDISFDLMSQITKPEIVTTHTVKEIDARLLPWRFPSFIYQTKSFLSGRGFIKWPPLLTLFCVGLTKGPS
jgi:SAM-dependent methyltransferase